MQLGPHALGEIEFGGIEHAAPVVEESGVYRMRSVATPPSTSLGPVYRLRST